MKLSIAMPKIIKPNIELDKLGVDPSLRNMELVSMQFPSVLPEKYVMLWDEFIETQAIQELYASYKKPIGLMYSALAFISYVSNIDSVKYYDVQEFSRKHLNSELQSIVKTLNSNLTRRLFRKLPLISIEVSVQDSYNEVVRGFYEIDAQAYLVFGNNNASRKSEGTFSTTRVKTSLSEELFKYSSYMFGSSTPPDYLLGKKNPGSDKRKFTKHGNLKQIKHYNWNPLEWDIKTYIIRLDENYLAVRVPIKLDMLYFTGSDRPSVIKTRIENQIKQAMRKLK